MARTGKPKSASDEPIEAAGTVLWRPATAGVELALVHRPKYDDWSFPKGKLLAGEHPLLAARRETAEETGQHIVLGRRLPTQRYLVNGRRKRVRFWSARGIDGGVFEPTSEIDRLVWLSPREARQRLSYAHDAELVRAFEAAPVNTVPVTLLRHASAMARARWTGDDQRRPLSPAGHEQARLIARLYPCFGEQRLLSSPALRCLQTIEELAHDDASVTREPTLTEEAYAQAPQRAVTLMREVLRAGRGTLVCTHRPLLPTLYATAVAGTHVRQSRSPLAAGDGFVLHVHRGQVVAADRLKS